MRLKTRTLTLLEGIRTSFWFIPSTMLAIAIVLAKLSIAIDESEILREMEWFSFLYKSNAQTVISLLTMMAGSMITVTSIVFSITVLSLSLASSQFGPRLIRHFMADTATKMVIGTFLATFIYCLLIIEVAGEFYTRGHVPGMSVYFAVFLVFASIAVLIFFIHHVARSIQADQVISDVEHRINQKITDLFPDEHEAVARESHHQQTLVSASEHFAEHCILHARDNGYVQAIDYELMYKICCKANYAVDINYRPGHFVIAEMPLFTLYYEKKHSEHSKRVKELRRCVVLGSMRTPVQDPGFAIYQLVEIAVRALSPGINDPFSAIACVDKLSAAMCRLTRRTFPRPYLADKNGIVRVKRNQESYRGIGDAAFDQIRQYSTGSLSVTIRLLEGLYCIATLATKEEHRAFVSRQLDMLVQALDANTLPAGDFDDISRRATRIRQALTNSKTLS